MKITKVRARVLSHAFGGTVLRFGVGNVVKRDLVLVEVWTDDGVVGYGEAHHALSPTAVAELINTSIAPVVVGQDPFDTEGIWHRVYRHQIATHGAGTLAVIGLSGVDIALWDLKGKLLGQPVYRLLGGARKKIRAYAGGLSLGFGELRQLESEVAALVSKGYTAIKLRVGLDAREDGKRVGHIRKVFGNELDIAVDAATRYAVDDLPEVAAYCEAHRVYWIEEPFTPDNVAAYRRLKEWVRVPVAAGENHYTKHAFRDLLTAGAIDIIQADCTKAGGLTELRKIAALAEAWHLRVAPHTSQSIISTAANLHLLCATPSGLIYEADVAPVNPWRDELALNPPQVVDGYIEPPDGPGLGLELDLERIEKAVAIPGPAYLP